MPTSSTISDDMTLRDALRALPVEEVLSLAYHFRAEPLRLRLYLDVLRQSAGHKAALAASLICYDLALQGQDSAQREFEALAETLRAFAAREAAAQSLIAGSPYLEALWPRCAQALEGLDPRINAATMLTVDDSEVLDLDLFADEELVDFDDILEETVDLATMRRRYQALVDDFFFHHPDGGGLAHGFFARDRRELEAVQHFVRELDSLRDFVPEAVGMLSMSELFLASHLRLRTFWGKPNPQRMEMTELGLRHFFQAELSVHQAAACFVPRNAELQAWAKISQLLMDFFVWRAQQPLQALAEAAKNYAQTARPLPRLNLSDRRQREN